ncbi:uncharacterized mitochondrial protein AtMg00820-like [Helianthus annuus]|uniref:uncharacterized mitochondrial protein AtMg00820-like n=1 Tax=Helianthus annuus TaxID=4232 RepID=UPI000B8F7223|nr:uncharacterized mitochondrial protein AtMg00820-like [Helianthus annuus]
MTTRLKAGITKPKHPINLHTSTSPTISPIPKSHLTALTDPHWQEAMNDEYRALMENNTWELVPRPHNAHIIHCMWLYRHKFHANGTLQRYKARLVVNGKSQQVGMDCFDTFSPVVKPTTIQTVLSIAVSRAWPIHQLDVKNAFLHGDLNETVYMFQPPGFVNKQHPSFVASYANPYTALNKLHGLGITASDDNLLQDIITSLSTEFAMTDLGHLHHFLGIQVTRNRDGLFLSQGSYVRDILE